ncbi:tether containing UBX domain for GLUT4-like [Glandiceps talaboti]
MATTVQVLAPNGRRQNVKVTPNTSILQIIEEVCTKQDFNTEEYDLKHHRTILDVNVPIRYSNLPNNAKLELVKAAKPRKVSDVCIALQLESNERLQHTFHPHTSLWEILEYWDNEETQPSRTKLTQVPDETCVPPLQPICIYMTKELIGEKCLRKTTIKSLGLTGGKSIIRFVYRSTEIPKEETTAPKPARQTSTEKTKPVPSPSIETQEKTMTQSAQQEVATPMETEPSTTQSSTKSKNESASKSTSSTSASASSPKPMDVEALEKIELTAEQEEQAMIMGRSLAQAIFRHRLEEEEEEERKRQAQKRQRELHLQRQREKEIERRQKELESVSPRESFANFKFPEETKGQTLFVNEHSSLSGRAEPCDREPLVFNPDADVPRESTTTDEIPDDFFEVTIDDVKNMYSDLQHGRAQFDEQPMMTKSMREMQTLRMLEKYPKVVIRIHFPDRLVLQGIFRPLEPVQALVQFVKSHLDDQKLKFYLYTTPPKVVLKDHKKSLYEAKLVPAANVYFGCETQPEQYLTSSLLQEVTTPTQADIKFATVSTLQQMEDDTKSKEAKKTTQTKRSSAASPTTAGPSSGDKLPKWFKIGKK